MWLLHAAMATLLAVLASSLLYMCTLAMWLCLMLLVNPTEALALLLLLATGPVYMVFAFRTFYGLRETFEQSLRAARMARNASEKARVRAGLDLQTITRIVVVGALVLTAGLWVGGLKANDAVGGAPASA